MPEGTLPAKQRRSALEVLSRDRLAELTSAYDLSVEDRRNASSVLATRGTAAPHSSCH